MSSPAWVALVLVILGTVSAVAVAMSQAAKSVKNAATDVSSAWTALAKLLPWRPRRPSRLAQRRARFAEYLEGQLRLLGIKEEWSDHRFTELEAEVEIEGRQRRWPLVPRRWANREGLRRVRSLSRALERSAERIVLLQGEPGAGKSVALRHLAQTLAKQAGQQPSETSVIPLYINLKEFKPTVRPVDHNQIREFVRWYLARANDRDINEFLAEEFDRGMDEGLWLFLFDSFDELPDVLAATEVDAVIEEYSDALFTFLYRMEKCRGIIASREFRGPQRMLPRFTIVRLSLRQRQKLISRALLPEAVEQQLLAGLATVDDLVAELAGNPLFLSLLCEYLKAGHAYPDSSHVVFQAYIQHRLSRDSDAVQRRFGLDLAQYQRAAEEIAFRMAAVPGLGLSPTRRDIRLALRSSGQRIDRLNACLDALEFIKIARAPESEGAPDEQPFTFAHRRFQEYFATSVVLRQPDRVTHHDLLTDGRWREAAVTILQTQQGQPVEDLIGYAERLLNDAFATAQPAAGNEGDTGTEGKFRWPPKVLHILDLLAAGAGRTRDKLPASLRESASAFLELAWDRGRLHDRKWIVEVSSVATTQRHNAILEEAFKDSSVLLQRTAYLQAGRLLTLSDSLQRGMRRALIGMSCGGRLRRNRRSVLAQVRRLADPHPLVRTIHLLVALPFVDFALLAALTTMVARPYVPLALCGLLMTHSSIYVIRASPFYAIAPTYSSAFDRIIDGLSWLFGDSRDAPTESLRALWFLRIQAILLITPGTHSVSVTLELLLVVAAYALLWAPCTLLAVDTGVPPPVWLWPLAPLWTAPRIRKALGGLRLRWRPVWVTFVVALVGIGIIALIRWPSFVPSKALLVIRAAIFFGIIAVIVFGIVAVPVKMALDARALVVRMRRIRDDKRYCAGLVANQTPLNAARAAEALVVLHTAVGIQELVRALRREELAYTDGAVAFFDDFVATLRMSKKATESGPKRKVTEFVAAPGASAEFQAWIDERNASDKKRQQLRAVSLDTIDQLSELVGRRLASGDDRVSALG